MMKEKEEQQERDAAARKEKMLLLFARGGGKALGESLLVRAKPRVPRRLGKNVKFDFAWYN